MTRSEFALSPELFVFLIRMAFVTTVILTFTLLGCALLRRKSAAVRHGVWFGAVLSCCVAPLFVALIPVPAFLVVLSADETVAPQVRQDVNAKSFESDAVSPDLADQDIWQSQQYRLHQSELVLQDRLSDIDAIEPVRNRSDFESASTPKLREKPQKPLWHQFIIASSGWLTSLWLIVGLFFISRTVLALLATRRLCDQSDRSDDPAAVELMSALRQQLRIRRPVCLKVSEEISVPMIAGIFRPCLLLPTESELWSADRLQAVLRHELGHVARSDLASQFVAELATAVWWFQPLLWYAVRRMRFEREFACDDLVLQSGTSPCDYAGELLAIASQAGSESISSPIVVAMAGRTTVEQRIRAILNPALNRIPWSRRGAAAMTIVLLVALSIIAPLTPTISAIQPNKATKEEQVDVARLAEEKVEQPKQPARVTAVQDAVDRDRVQIVCVDSGTKPIAGAEIYLFQFDGKTKSYKSFGPYTSDQAGKVVCEEALYYTQDQAEDPTRTGNYDRWIYARQPGRLVGVARCTRWKYRGEYNAEGRVVLYSSHSIEGQVSVPQGFDVTNVKVFVRSFNVSTGPGSLDFQTFPRETHFPGLDTALPQVFDRFPDAAGKVRFDDVPIRGMLYVVTQAEGLGETQWRNDDQRFDKPMELKVPEESRLVGRVLTPDRKPAVGSKITARLQSTRKMQLMYETSFSATADANGDFAIRGLPQTDYLLTISDPQKEWRFRPLRLGTSLPNTELRQTCVFEKAVRVAGSVFDELGRPVAGASVSAMSDDQIVVRLDGAMTNEQGTFELHLPSGKAQFYFDAVPPDFLYPDPQFFKQLEILPNQAEINDLKVVLKRKGTLKDSATQKSSDGESNQPEKTTDSKTSSTEQKSADRKVASAQTDKKPDSIEKADLVHIAGQVVDENDHGVPGATVTFESYQEQLPGATADENGQFRFLVKPDAWKWQALAAEANDRQRMGTTLVSGELSDAQRKQLKIKLATTRKHTIRVVDQNGQPISDATAGIITGGRDAGAARTDANGSATILVAHDADIDFAYAVKGGIGLDYRSFVLARNNRTDRNAVRPKFPDEGVTLTLDGVQPLELTMQTNDDQPISGAGAYIWQLQKPGETEQLNLSILTRRKLFIGQTDEQGHVSFNWIPQWQKGKLTIWPRTQDFMRARGSYDPQSGTGKAILKLERLVSMRGKVLRPDGSPANGIAIDVAGAGYTFDDFRHSTQTKEDGSFEVKATPNQLYLLVVKDQKWSAQPLTGFALWPNQPIDNLNFQLIPTTRIHGRVTLGPEQKPVAGVRISSYQYGQDNLNLKDINLPNPEKSNKWVCPMVYYNAITDADGRYEFFVGPGKFDIRGPNQNKIENYEITNQTEKEFDFHMDRPEKGILKGLVIDAETGQPVVGAKMLGIERWHFSGDLQAVTDDAGRFEVERNLHLTAMYVTTADRSKSAILEVDADAKEVTIKVQPTASASGILIDEEINAPLAEKELVYGIQIHMGDDKAPFRTTWGGTIKTDKEGRFQLKNLTVGGNYRLNRTLIDGRSWSQVASVTPETPGEMDLGTITIKKDQEYKAPTTGERIQAAFKSEKNPIERFEGILPDAKLSRLRVLILFASPNANATTQFMTLRYEDSDVSSAFDDFRLIAVNSAPGHDSEAKLLAKKVGRDLQGERSVFFAVVTDADGTLIDSATTGVLMRDGVINQEKMLAFLAKNRLAPLVAKDLYDDALLKAKQENKRIILQETATWCGPCWGLSRFLNQHRSEWEKDYLWVKMDHRWVGATDLMKSIRGDAQGGIPWCAIINSDAKVLVTSNTPSGENIGFPTEPEEINHFQAMLKRTAQRMTPEEIEALVANLRQKK